MSAVMSKVDPSRHLYEGHEYTPAVETDIRKTFAKFFADAQKPETAESYQESAIAENNSPQIPRTR